MKTEQIRDRQYRDCMSTLPDVRTSESVTIGNLRDINVRLQKQISTQDDTIYGLVNEIDELDRRLAARKEQTDFLEVRVVDCIAELVASERTNQITEQAIKSAERALIEKGARIAELERKVDDLRTINNNSCKAIDRRDDQITEIEAELAKCIAERDDAHAGFRSSIESIKELFERIEEMEIYAKWNGNQHDIVVALRRKLADRERQFEVLDGVLDKTRGLLHVAENYIREQNVRIAELESDRDNESDKRRRIVDRWNFHVGDKVTSTNRAKQLEIYVSGVVVDIRGDVLYVYVDGDEVRLVSKMWM